MEKEREGIVKDRLVMLGKELFVTSRNPNSSKKLLMYVMIFERMINFCLTKSFRIKSKYL